MRWLKRYINEGSPRLENYAEVTGDWGDTRLRGVASRAPERCADTKRGTA